MSRYRIRRVTEKDEWLVEAHKLVTNPKHGGAFVLVDKDGNLYSNKAGKVPVYMTDVETTKKHPELLFAQQMDAYAYFANYAEAEDILLKTHSTLDLLAPVNADIEIKKKENVELELFSYAIGNYKESESTLAKPIKKIANSLDIITQELGTLDKQMGKLRVRMADLDVERENWLLDREDYNEQVMDQYAEKKESAQFDESWYFEEKDDEEELDGPEEVEADFGNCCFPDYE